MIMITVRTIVALIPIVTVIMMMILVVHIGATRCIGRPLPLCDLTAGPADEDLVPGAKPQAGETFQLLLKVGSLSGFLLYEVKVLAVLLISLHREVLRCWIGRRLF